MYMSIQGCVGILIPHEFTLSDGPICPTNEREICGVDAVQSGMQLGRLQREQYTKKKARVVRQRRDNLEEASLRLWAKWAIRDGTGLGICDGIFQGRELVALHTL